MSNACFCRDAINLVDIIYKMRRGGLGGKYLLNLANGTNVFLRECDDHHYSKGRIAEETALIRRLSMPKESLKEDMTQGILEIGTAITQYDESRSNAQEFTSIEE